MIVYILILLANILSIFGTKFVLETFLNERRTSTRIFVLSLLVYRITVTGIFFATDEVLINTVVPWIGIFMLSLNYKAYIVKRFALIGCFLLISYAGQGFFNLLFSLFPNLLVYITKETGSVMSLTFLSIAAFLLKNFKNIKKDSINVPTLWSPLIFLPVIHMISTLLFRFNVPYSAAIESMVLWTGVCFVVYYLYDNLSAAYEDKLSSAIHEKEKEYYYNQCTVMHDSVDKMMSFRHDIKTHLAALKEYSEKGKPEDIAGYIDDLIEDIGKSEVYSNTGNIAFDSIINYKLRNIKDDNIVLDLKTSVPTDLNVDVVDIVTIFGNLLDNALDAVSKVSERFIKVDIEYDRGGLFAKVENSFNGEVDYKEGTAKNKNQIISLKKDGIHGFGLRNIKKSLEKYDGHLEINHDDNIFSVGILLYADVAAEASN